VTHDTTKLSLAFPVAAVGMPAGATALAGVGRIDQRYWHPHPLRLVAEKRPQLPKGPIVVPCSLCCAPNPRPLANMLQIFQRNFGNTADCHLRGKTKLFTHGLIGQPMDRELPERVRLPRHLTDIITRSIGGRKRALQRIHLFGRWLQFQLDRQSHNMMVSHIERPCKYALKRAEAWRFLRRLKPVSLRA
jgi:hypothetical protein